MTLARNSWLAGLLLLGVLAPPLAAAADEPAPRGDATRGRTLGYTCYGCHGIADYRNAYPAFHVPKIGGQHEAYLLLALNEYRQGLRSHPTMHTQAASLSEQELRDLAAYFGAGAPEGGSRAGGAAPAAAQVCAACHGANGVGVLPEYPTLSGQHRDYVEQALRAYRQGTRKNPVMNGFAAALKDEDIRVLAEYFAQQSPSLTVPQLKLAR